MDWQFANIAPVQRRPDRGDLLFAPAAGLSVVDSQLYDIDRGSERTVQLDDGAPVGGPLTANGRRGSTPAQALTAGVRNVSSLDYTLNPPAVDPWGCGCGPGCSTATATATATPTATATASPTAPTIARASPTSTKPIWTMTARATSVMSTSTATAMPTAPTPCRATPPTGSTPTTTAEATRGANPDDDGDGYPDLLDPDPLDPGVVPPARCGVYHPGDGIDELGLWRPNKQRFLLDANGSRTWNRGDRNLGDGQPGDPPLSGDWEG